jgi:Omp85 superfamily domain
MRARTVTVTPSFRRRPRGGLAILVITGLVAGGASFAADAAYAQQAALDPSPRETADSATAVSTRAEQIAKEQAAKALVAKPYQPSGIEKVFDRVQDRLAHPPRFYPWFGSIYPGGLIALGAGYREAYGDTGLFDVHGGWSLRNFTGVDANLHLPELAGRRVKFDVHGQYINAPKVRFYGVGQDSSDQVTYFLYRPTSVGGTFTFMPTAPLSVGAGLDFIDAHTGAGKRGVSIEQQFTPQTAPGLGMSPTYLRTRAFAGFDSRESPGYTRRGALYRVEWSDYRQQNDGPFSFRRLDAEARQFVPLLRENWVLAFRGLVSTTYTSPGEEVPFFLMPELGGGSDLRGYPSWRFRDRHRILLTGEYRWMAGQFVDMALFVDAGKVTSRRSDLDLTHLVPTYGIGIRFHGPSATVLRAEVAKTREGFGLVFTAGQIF